MLYLVFVGFSDLKVSSFSRQAHSFLSQQLCTQVICKLHFPALCFWFRVLSGPFLELMSEKKGPGVLALHSRCLCTVDWADLEALQRHCFDFQTHTHTFSIPFSTSVTNTHTCSVSTTTFSFPLFHFTHAESCSLPSAAPCPCYNPAFGTSASCPHTHEVDSGTRGKSSLCGGNKSSEHSGTAERVISCTYMWLLWMSID